MARRFLFGLAILCLPGAATPASATDTADADGAAHTIVTAGADGAVHTIVTADADGVAHTSVAPDLQPPAHSDSSIVAPDALLASAMDETALPLGTNDSITLPRDPFDLGPPPAPAVPGLEGGRAWFSLDDPDRPYWKRSIFLRVIDDQRFLLTNWMPSEFRDPAFAIPVIATAGLAIASREVRDLDRHLTRQAHAYLDEPAGYSGHVLTQMGNGAPLLAGLALSYAIGRGRGNDRLARASSLAAEAVLDEAILVTLLKRLSGRPRPDSPEPGEFFRYNIEGADPPHSFPSGHSMVTFAVATVFAKEYRERRSIVVAAYGLATAVAVSRVWNGRHFPTDIVVGAFLGNSLGRMVTSRQGGEYEALGGAPLITAWVDPGSGAAMLGLRRSF